VRRVRTSYLVAATWAPGPPSAGQVFDVEVKRDAGAWRPLLTGATLSRTRLSAGARRGSATALRARVRRADDVGARIDGSPDAVVKRP
jgi:hypothetical protein